MYQGLLVASGVLGFLTIAGGAFGAHALRDVLAPDRLVIFSTGTHYGQLHAAALLAVAALAHQQPRRAYGVAGVAFILGALLFTGSLWLLVLTDTRWLGAITPLGGVSFLVGWLALLIAGATAPPAAPTPPR
jgi:uncharacterized membrane protein YgdD (TMEM256/DUF423 family)